MPWIGHKRTLIQGPPPTREELREWYQKENEAMVEFEQVNPIAPPLHPDSSGCVHSVYCDSTVWHCRTCGRVLRETLVNGQAMLCVVMPIPVGFGS